MRIDQKNYKAAVLDMDGVITQTAKLHARAWKRMFDEYLQQRSDKEGKPRKPFADHDYREYVDGKPRYDGVRSFLESRGIELPEGDESDGPEQETICGLGNRKNETFHKLLASEGVEVYDDTMEQVGNWKRDGLKVAVISSSRNCEAVLNAAHVLELFDARVDGHDVGRHGLRGKPAPDVFLEAARRLDVEPGETIVVEDAIAGVQAGRAGRFGLVVGVARNRDTDELRQAGADMVVHDLRDLQASTFCPPGEDCLRTPSSALEHSDWIANRLKGRKLGLFLDYDGTLTPIVGRPEDATLSDEMRSLLSQLAAHCTLAIVSGRDRRNVEQMVRLGDLVYAGSHGFDIHGPGGLDMQQPDAVECLPDLDDAERKLHERIDGIAGARVERKKFAIAVHYREADDEDVPQIEEAVNAVLGGHPRLRKRGGKKIFELQPDVEWDKGRAVLWLAEALGLKQAGAVLVYIGDDVTDEDAFAALRLRGAGVGIRVGLPTSGTQASYYLRDCGEIEGFLRSLLQTLERTDS